MLWGGMKFTVNELRKKRLNILAKSEVGRERRGQCKKKGIERGREQHGVEAGIITANKA